VATSTQESTLPLGIGRARPPTCSCDGEEGEDRRGHRDRLCENIKAREKVPAGEQLTCYHKEPERAGGRVAEASKMYSEEAEHSTVLLSMPLTMLRQPCSPARMQAPHD